MLELQVVCEKDTKESAVKQVRVLHNKELAFLSSTIPTIRLLLADLGLRYPNNSEVELTENYAVFTMKIDTTREVIVRPYERNEEIEVDGHLVASIVNDKVIKAYAGRENEVAYLYYPKEVVENYDGVENLSDRVTLQSLSLI
ncbi:hypothetical protein ACQUY5_16550 [Bacillus cereus]|uniref:hypothetical protein n=1 Tax=Bacillus cereus TaxID=1396 RepID=UPI003D174A7F